MKKKIFKYVFDERRPHIAMPAGSKIVSVGKQHGHIVIWAEVWPDEKLVQRRIVAVVTGAEVPDDPDRIHLGTIGFNNDNFILHLYELPGEAIHG